LQIEKCKLQIEERPVASRELHTLYRPPPLSHRLTCYQTGWSSGFSRSAPAKPGTPTSQTRIDKALGFRNPNRSVFILQFAIVSLQFAILSA
jgi:hypothetical protein